MAGPSTDSERKQLHGTKQMGHHPFPVQLQNMVVDWTRSPIPDRQAPIGALVSEKD